MRTFMLTSAALVLLAGASTTQAANGGQKPTALPAELAATGPIPGPAPQHREVMNPMSHPLVGALPTEPVRFAKADAEFQELLGKRLPLPVDGPFADLLRSVKPIPAPAAAPAEPTEIQTARAN
jgi:hypothetical protein